MPKTLKYPLPSDVYPARPLSKALLALGNYVYAYYRPGELIPFYVGKGSANRVLDHWKNAVKSGNRLQEVEIRSILEKQIPTIKLLAYNLERTPRAKVSLVAERVLQDAFGIQKVWEKKAGKKRLTKVPASLLQIREDSKESPVLSIESVLAKCGDREEISPSDVAEKFDAPVLLVGLLKTYHPSYGQEHLAEMARKYWNLDLRAKFPDLRQHKAAILLAWSSKIDGQPRIVGAWRIKMGTWKKEAGRYSAQVQDVSDLELRKACIGMRLPRTGNSWQGQRIVLPSSFA